MTGILPAIGATVRRDTLLVARRPGEVLTALFFFVIVVSLFPLAIGPELNLLRRIAPGILWVAALLATLLGLQRLFSADYADGTLEQMALGPQPFALLMAGKVLAHWLTSGLPLVLVAPVLGILLDLPVDALVILMVSLALGTPILSLIGAVGAALTLGVRGSSVLLSLLVLPLYVPTLIFGAGAVESHMAGLGATGHLAILAALLSLALFFAPWAVAAALRIALD